MAKTSMKMREVKRAKTVAKYAEKRAELKTKSVDMSLSYEERMEAMDKLARLPRNASPVRQQRRCKLTGRPHGVYKKFGLSRNMLRLYAMQGDVPGLRKASW
ncbi:30S ribosomal protein S14 [Thiomicrospira aerophila AL3]|uniref:Small ribosomal subunit protein uS14 n=1 Tax=Thiomicrospira aerophila AL3 TaxID=717772 RepID=W0DUC5_9GAMM|nr:30S ribosomal protein S14 [Thiomicrospira aerophila]AHF00486.1 30S ribosomal protein S14 [Thiomicrospira aerophila AL3]